MSSPIDIETDLQAIYAELEKAFQQKDLAAIDFHTSSDFVAHTPDGKDKDREQLLADLGQRFQEVDVLTWPRRIVRLETLGENIAIVMAVGPFRTRPIGQPEAAISEIELANEDRWERRDGRWVLTASRPAELTPADRLLWK